MGLRAWGIGHGAWGMGHKTRLRTKEHEKPEMGLIEMVPYHCFLKTE
jgi:hypothetical protein